MPGSEAIQSPGSNCGKIAYGCTGEGDRYIFGKRDRGIRGERSDYGVNQLYGISAQAGSWNIPLRLSTILKAWAHKSLPYDKYGLWYLQPIRRWFRR